MQALKLAALAALTFATTALAQGNVTLPAHATTYNGFSRGYNFTANTNMIIAGLDLPLDAFQAGDTASYLVRVNGTQVLHSIGNAGPISTTILVNTGDIVDVIGNWSPATPGNFTAHNSYGNSAPFATTINGVAHTLNRTGWQWDVGDPAFAGSYLNPGTGSIGRIFMTATPQAGIFANFTATPSTGASPLAVQFTDTTFTDDPGGVTQWAWDFENDGTVDSTLQNPSHIYTACGTYDVSLTATDVLNGSSTETKLAFVVTDAVVASFTSQVLAPSIVQFTDTSTPTPTAWSWDFDNDGTVDSTVQNPVFAYPAGTGLVDCVLTASRLCGPASTASEQLIPTTSIVTTFAGGNGLTASGSGNVFDLNVTNPLGITLTGVVMSPWVTTPGPVTVDVYLTEDDTGYAANHSNQALWRLVGTGSATTTSTATSGAPIPVDMPLAQRIHIAPGNYSMALHMTGAGVVYTTGNGTNQVYSNADMTITCGGGKGAPFATGMNNPRVWNGALIYDDCAIGGLAGYGYLGNGCAGSAGVSNLQATSNPALGGTLSININNLPINVAIMTLGLSNTSSILGPLPLDLTGFGAPGCSALVSPDSNTVLIGAGGVATYNLNLPNNPIFICTPIFNQAFVVDPGFNGLGGVMSDAGTGILGN